MARTFDETELLERVEGDIEFLGDTVEMLTADGPVLLEQLKRFLAAGDAQAVGRSAHALKGMVSNFCAADVVRCALEVERMGKSGSLESATAAMRALEEGLGSLTAELVQFVKARRP